MVSLTEDLNGYIHNESVADKLTTGGMIPLELQADYLGCLEEFQDEVTKRLTNAAVHDRVLLQSRGNLITEVSKNNFDRMDLCQELIQEELEELQDELDAPEINPEKENHKQPDLSDLIEKGVNYGS